MEGDNDYFFFCVRIDISIHSLRMEGDCFSGQSEELLFYFNPLPPYGGRRKCLNDGLPDFRFQSTPSVWRETSWTRWSCSHRATFQSTPSVWRETFQCYTGIVDFFISIHSLRMEGDYGGTGKIALYLYFNPLPPYGGRPQLW